MATITKKELIDRIVEELNREHPRAPIKNIQVKRVVQKFLDMIIAELAEGNRLEFREFGVFESKRRAARVAQNPKTLERVRVPPKRSVKFKAGRLMKEKLLQASLEAVAEAGASPEMSERTPGVAASADPEQSFGQPGPRGPSYGS